MPTGKRFNLTRAARPAALPEFLAFVDESCMNAGLDQTIISDLKSAVEEACTNIIQHGYAGMNPGSILLTLTCYPTHVLIDIRDFGHPFEPEVPDMTDPQVTGSFGLPIIYQTMDRIEYEAGAPGNHLTFTRWLIESQSKSD